MHKGTHVRCVYTQLSDIEGETNGLYTYDRVVRKVDEAAARRSPAGRTSRRR